MTIDYLSLAIAKEMESGQYWFVLLSDYTHPDLPEQYPKCLETSMNSHNKIIAYKFYFFALPEQASLK